MAAGEGSTAGVSAGAATGAAGFDAALAPELSPLSRKFTVTVITTGTGTPLRSVGL